MTAVSVVVAASARRRNRSAMLRLPRPRKPARRKVRRDMPSLKVCLPRNIVNMDGSFDQVGSGQWGGRVVHPLSICYTTTSLTVHFSLDNDGCRQKAKRQRGRMIR